VPLYVLTLPLLSISKFLEEDKMKGLIIDRLHPVVKEILSQYLSLDEDMLPSKEKLTQEIGAYDALIMRVDPLIDRSVLGAAKKLKVIGVGSVGLNHIDLDYAKEKGITVYNVPGVNFEAVAELTIGSMIALLRHSFRACRDVKERGIWDKYAYTGEELRGKTLGIIALGRIGSRVAEFAQVFGMKVLAYDPYLNSEQAAQRGAELVSLPELLKNSDVVTVHSPLTAETRHLISTEQFAIMKDGSYLLNMGRGGVVDEEALYEALVTGKLAGAALDVMEKEPCTSSPLYELDNFLITPHLGGQTFQAHEEIGRILAGKILQALGIIA
jgi:D-3-phosphoglycerate dehydrogenase